MFKILIKSKRSYLQLIFHLFKGMEYKLLTFIHSLISQKLKSHTEYMFGRYGTDSYRQITQFKSSVISD